MSKRDEIDQLRHDFFMLSRRVETMESHITELLAVAARQKEKDYGINKTFEQIQIEWNEQNNRKDIEQPF